MHEHAHWHAVGTITPHARAFTLARERALSFTLHRGPVAVLSAVQPGERSTDRFVFPQIS